MASLPGAGLVINMSYLPTIPRYLSSVYTPNQRTIQGELAPQTAIELASHFMPQQIVC